MSRNERNRRGSPGPNNRIQRFIEDNTVDDGAEVQAYIDGVQDERIRNRLQRIVNIHEENGLPYPNMQVIQGMHNQLLNELDGTMDQPVYRSPEVTTRWDADNFDSGMQGDYSDDDSSIPNYGSWDYTPRLEDGNSEYPNLRLYIPDSDDEDGMIEVPDDFYFDINFSVPDEPTFLSRKIRLEDENRDSGLSDEELYLKFRNEIVGSSIPPITQEQRQSQDELYQVLDPSRLPNRIYIARNEFERTYNWKTCHNSEDYILQTDFSENDSIVFIHDQTQERFRPIFCFDTEMLLKWFDREQTELAEWVGGDDVGYDGRQNHDFLMYTLPNGTMLIDEESVRIILMNSDQSKLVFHAYMTYNNLPVGNVHGVMGASNLHGNNPKNIYRLVPVLPN